jgi:signal transduction histidine kinase
VAITEDQRQALRASLSDTLALVDASPFGSVISDEDRDSAGQAADALFTACGGGSIAVVRLVFAAELLATIAIDLAADRDEAGRLVARLQIDGEVPAATLGREVLRSGRILELPAELAVEVILALILVFAGGEAIALWNPNEDGRLAVACRVGEPGAPGTTARFATSDRLSSVVQIDGLADDDAAGRVLVTASAPMLERHRQLVTPAGSISAVERRLARLRFDLHDGPQQDVHLLAQDLRLFRDQLGPLIAGHVDEERALGRLDDLEAQLVALDDDLRQLATTVQSPFLAPDSLSEGLRQLTETFARRTGVIPRTNLRGSLTSLTDSQQIALLSLIREALSNIRKHSDAERVQIAIEANIEGVRVEVTDDGGGFDPQSTRVRSARAGRLGLVGMHERVRMLGGSTRIDSRPGGPTVITASLPPWSAD